METPLPYSAAGQGIPLLLIHGFPHDRSAWAPQLERLSEHAHVIAVDLRGPASRSTPAAITMEMHARDVAALMDHLGLERAVICGLSMGGYIALAFALAHPERLRGLVLCNTRAGADDAQAREGREEVAQRALKEGTAVIARGMAPKMVTPAAPVELRRSIEAMMARQQPATVAAWARGMALRADQRGRLGSIEVPTLIITSDGDEAVPPADSTEMHRAMPGSELVVIPGAGHMSNLEAPEAFDRAVKTFLRGL